MCCDCKGPRSDLSLLKGVLEEYASQPGSLITILQQAQGNLRISAQGCDVSHRRGCGHHPR